MNTTQIKCFLTLAETLNFTRAAERLYISQPALSRQISTLEQEINSLLFIRDQKSVRLTPAGTLLAGELGAIQSSLDDLIARVRTVGMGYTGTLTLGVLEGQWMGEEFTGLYRRFMDSYPNIDFRMGQGSFGTLRRQLDSGEIDIAITLSFDVAGLEQYISRPLFADQAVFAISRERPLAQKEHITFADLISETLLVISPEDCRVGSELVFGDLREQGLKAPRIRYAPNLSTVMLWVEAGLGVGIINHQSNLARNPNVRLISEIPLQDASPCLAWRRDNLNPAIALFDQMMAAYGDKLSS